MNFLPQKLAVLLMFVCMHSCPVLAAGDTSSAGQQKSSEKPKQVDYEKLSLADLVRRAHAENAKAQFELGARFNYGRGVPKNVAEALVWLRRAGLAGQKDAQRLLAVKFFNGYDVTVDHAEAFRWTQRLAETGDLPAQVTLGSMYANGEGVARDLVHSYMWYDIAVVSAQQLAAKENALPTFANDAGVMRDQIGALLLPDEEQEAQRLASDWWLKKHGVSLLPKVQVKQGKQKAKSAR